jgi:arginyl-tRNA synthetase
MSLVQQIKDVTAKAIEDLYKVGAHADDVLVNQTKPEFEGHYTVVLFALVKQLRKSPEALGQEIGSYLIEKNSGLFTGFNVIKGFLNLSIADQYYLNFLSVNHGGASFTQKTTAPKKVMVEYSSPNTNKPLHLGHLRNNFLGWSIAEILKAAGNDVMKTCIVNDRGVHICKSMKAWEDFANGETPESTKTKGDHFVGDYYVKAENIIKEQSSQILGRISENDFSDFDLQEREVIQKKHVAYLALKEKKKEKEASEEYANIVEAARKNSFYMRTVQQMLVDWEAGKPEVIELWKKMNSWVYEGFDKTYKRIGSDFDKTYYESQTYLLGRDFVEKGLQTGVFYKKEDGSVWIDLTDEGLDEKLVLRKDGTSVYITQDLGLAHQKYEEFPYDQSIYVIADEQNYHMKVLQLMLKKLGMPYANGIYHLSYGMVELPTGRMKSREGTVVDADDLMDEMVREAEKQTAEKSNTDDFSQDELKELYETIALGALKFYLIKVDPKKRMVFNPEESIDFHGFTGPFIQYTHARLKSILRKADAGTLESKIQHSALTPLEKELLLLLEQYPSVVNEAASAYNPASIANYIYNVAKTCNSFYTEHKVLKAENEEKKTLRLQLSAMTANIIKEGMHLLGIKVPERM